MNRITATLSVLSEKIQPDKMTSILSFTPDHSVLKGSSRIPPRPTPKSFGWYVTSTQYNEITVDGVISILLNRLGTLYNQIQKLYDIDPDVQVKFLVSVVPYSDDISLYFRAETISAVSKFGGSLDIEFFDM